jgi:hypothetical protein
LQHLYIVSSIRYFQVMRPWRATQGYVLVWNFEFGSRAAQALPQRQRLRGVCAACWNLFEIWYLVLGIFLAIQLSSNSHKIGQPH